MFVSYCGEKLISPWFQKEKIGYWYFKKQLNEESKATYVKFLQCFADSDP